MPHAKPKVGLEIGPGVCLTHVFGNGRERVGALDWSPDGALLTSIGESQEVVDVRVWDLAANSLVRLECDPLNSCTALGWSSTGRYLAAETRIWERTADALRTVPHGVLRKDVSSLAWSPRGDRLALLTSSGEVGVLDMASEHRTVVNAVAGDYSYAEWGITWVGDDAFACRVSGKVRLFRYSDVGIESIDEFSLRLDSDDFERVITNRAMGWTPAAQRLLFARYKKVEVYGVSGTYHTSLEGHTGAVYRLSTSSDGALVASVGDDGKVLLRRTDTWVTIASIPGPSREAYHNGWGRGLSFHPGGDAIATLDSTGTYICVWKIDRRALMRDTLSSDVRYSTVRVALLGESNVGKSHLGSRIAKGSWEPQPSTHGQRFWLVEALGMKREDGVECDAVLWDFAGQPDYRLVHALFLDEIDVALLLYDPTVSGDSFRGTEFWLRQLTHAAVRRMLVATKSDRGAGTFTAKEADEFCAVNAIEANLVTSALTGAGVDQLMNAIRAAIDWNHRPATVTTATFKRIKDHVLALKEGAAQPMVISTAELCEQLLAADPSWTFSDEELETAIGHAARHGNIMLLRSSQGQRWILLAPELLVQLASSFLLEARRNDRGLGSLEEDRVRSNGYGFPELEGRSEVEKQLLLDTAIRLFLEKNIAFREASDRRAYLILPDLINQKRPALARDAALVDDVSFIAKGAIANVFSALVVLLGYTELFTRRNQWQGQAQYSLAPHEICGFRQLQEREAEVEFVLYFHEDTPEPARTLFRGLFEKLLRARPNVEVETIPVVNCPTCRCHQDRATVVPRIRDRKEFVRCYECDERISLVELTRPARLARRSRRVVSRAEAQMHARTSYEAALVTVKRLAEERRGERPHPTCFISYAWGDDRREWAMQLAVQLQNADVDVLLDDWHSRPGGSVSEFAERASDAAFVVVIGTPELRRKYMAKDDPSVVAQELRIVAERMRRGRAARQTVIPLLASGAATDAFPDFLLDQVAIDARDPDVWLPKLFDLVLSLHGLSYDQPGVRELRLLLGSEIKRTSAQSDDGADDDVEL